MMSQPGQGQEGRSSQARRRGRAAQRPTPPSPTARPTSRAASSRWPPAAPGIVREVLVQEGDRTWSPASSWPARKTTTPAWRPTRASASLASGPRPGGPATRSSSRTAQREYKPPAEPRRPPTSWPASGWTPPRDQIARGQGQHPGPAGRDPGGHRPGRPHEARYNQELTVIRAPADGRIARRYANPGAGASTLNVSNMFDLEPETARIVRAEIAEGDLPNVAIGQDGRDPAGERSGPRSMSARCCAAPPCSAPASWPSDDPSRAQPTSASSRWWSAPTAPRY